MTRRAVLQRRIRWVVALTITYNVVEAVVALAAGRVASSAALIAFGLDSVVEVLSAAAAHRGTSLVEIYHNCPIFNDGAFDAIKNNDTKADAIIPLVHGEPIRFGTEGTLGVARDP